MPTLLEKAVTKADDDTWGFQCPGVKGDPCHGLVKVLDPKTGKPVIDPETDEPKLVSVPFSSTLWPTKKAAIARGAQHFSEHRLGAEIREAVGGAEAAAVEAARAKAKDQSKLDHKAIMATVDREVIRARVIKASKFAVMQELHHFRKDQGLVVNDDGSVSVEDLT